MLVRRVSIVLLLPLLLLASASASVLAQEASRLTLSVDQGVPSGELRLVRRSFVTQENTSPFRELGLAVSPDGRWLINATQEENIEIWKLDSARGIITQRMSAPRLGRSGFLAVSPDSRFVFVTDRASTGNITVFRLNADNGSLEEAASYTEGGEDAARNTIRGLISAGGVVLSPDGRRLFVTSIGADRDGPGGGLSVWSVNSSGTLVQTDVHVSAGTTDTRGLHQAASLALTPDGRLLFVAGINRTGNAFPRLTLGIWRVNAEASTVSFVRIFSDRRWRDFNALNVTFDPSGRFLLAAERRALFVYKVNAAAENLASVASYGVDDNINTVDFSFGLAATREVLAVLDREGGFVSLFQRNDDGTLRLVSNNYPLRQPIRLAASPAGGLIFSRSRAGGGVRAGITVWQVQGIPRVPAGQEVRVMVSAEPTLGSALTVTVQARQGSRVSTATATLMPSGTQAEAVFSERDLGQGEWIFSASVPEDMENIADASTARATLRIAAPPIRLSNLSGKIQERADLNIRISTEGMAPVAGDTEVTLRATREGAQPRSVMGLLQDGQTSVTVTFADINALTGGDWLLSAEDSALPTDASSTLAVTVIPDIPDSPPLSRLTLSVDQGAPSGEMRLVQTDNKALPTGNNEIERLAVSPNGRWLLASGGGGITVWEIDSARGIVTQRSDRMGAGLGGRGLAVSRESSLTESVTSLGDRILRVNQGSSFVFASDRTFLGTISVWHLNARNGGLEEVAQYTGGGTDAAGNTVTGLFDVSDVVLSPDDRLLFVTSRRGLNVWSVNTSGTLVQTDVHVPVGGSVDPLGLRQAAGAAVTPDGRLLFVGGGSQAFSSPGRLGIWRVNAEASAVSFVRTLSSNMLGDPRVVTLGPDGRFLFVSNQAAGPGFGRDPLSVYEVNSAAENLASVASYGRDDGILRGTNGLAATREVLAVAESFDNNVALWQRNDDGTLRFVSRHDSVSPVGLVASPAGGLIFSSSFDELNEIASITVWQVQGIPRVLAGRDIFPGLTPRRDMLAELELTGQKVRVMVSAEPTLGSNLDVLVQARQGRDIRFAFPFTFLGPHRSQAEAVFRGLGHGEWIFSVSQLVGEGVDRVDRTALSAARATLRIGGPFIRLSSPREIQQGLTLSIRIASGGRTISAIAPVEDAEVTLRAILQESAQQRVVTRILERGKTSLTVEFAGENALTEGVWTVSAESITLQTDARSRLTVTVGPPPLIRLENLSGEILQGADLNIRIFTEGMVTLEGGTDVTLRATQAGAPPRRVTGSIFGGRASVVVTFAGENALTKGDWVLSAEPSETFLLGTDANSRLVVTIGPPPLTFIRLENLSGEIQQGEDLNIRVSAAGPPVPRSIEVTLLARQAGARTRTAMGVLQNGQTSVTVTFAFEGEQFLTEGRWVLSASAEPFLLDTDADSALAVTVGPPPLIRLENLSGEIMQGANLDIRISTEGMAPLPGDAVVILRARLQESSQLRMVSGFLRKGQTSRTVTFFGDNTLTEGRWVLSAEPSRFRNNAEKLGTDANSTLAVTVRPPLLIRLENLSGEIPQGADLNIRVSAEGPPVPRDAEVTLRAAREGAQPRTVTGLLRGGQIPITVTFAGENALTEGDWILSAEVFPSILIGTDADSTLAVTVGPPPLIRLENLSGEIPQGADLNIRISTEGMAPLAGNGEVILRAAQAGAQPRTRTVTGRLRKGQISITVTFAGENALTEGDWILSAEVFPSILLGTDADSTLAVTVGPPPLIRLENLSGEIPQGADLNIRISTEGMAPLAGNGEVILRAAQAGAQPRTRTVTGRLRKGQISITVTFAGENALTEGDWILSAEVFPSILLGTDADSTLAVTVGPPLPRLTLSLQETAEPVVPAGSTLGITVMADHPLVQGLTVTVQAVRTAAAPATVVTAAVTIRLLAAEQTGNALFAGENALPPGQWFLTIANSAETPTQPLQVRIGPSALGLSAPMGLLQGRDAVIEVDTEVALGVEVRVIVMATHAEAPALTASAAAVLEPSALAAEARFPANMLSLVREGTWNFEITAAMPSVLMTDTEVFPLVDFRSASATLQVAEGLSLLLELPPQPVDPDQPVSIRLRKSTTSISEELTVTITAMRLLVGMTLTRVATAMLSSSDTTAAAVFGPGELSAGRWTLTASVTPPEAVLIRPSATTIMVRPPLLRLQRLGPDSVAVGTPVRVRVAAQAMPEDEGLGVRVIARQVLRVDRERSAVLGSGPDFSADVEFASLPPGEWLLTAEAERLGAFRTEGARDTVTVEPAVLTLTPVLERVPAGESARLILGSVVPLGVTVRVFVLAEPVSFSSQAPIRQVTLDAASTSAEVVFELAPGIWDFNVQVIDPADETVADASMATATLQVTEPTLLLELPPQPVDPAQPVSIRLRKSETVNLILTVDITAMRLFGGMTLTRVATAMLSPSDTTAAAVFGPGALSAGIWTLTARVRAPGTVPVFNGSTIPPTVTMTVRPPLLLLERLGPASVAAGTRITVRVAAEAMPEDEGLGVRVIARQAMRADIEISAVLGSQSDFSADVEFTSLPPGEWLLTAEAERPDAFRTEASTDMVTVEPAVLTLTPVLERVPAGESARLILGSIVPLGVAVNVTVVAEPVSLSSSLMTAVNLDEASTSAMVVYDPGELAPGIWNFNVQVMDAAVRMVANVSMATATLRIAAPLIRLANLSGVILQGDPLTIRVRTEGMIPVAGDAELTLRATLQEGTQQRAVTGRLLEGQTSVTVTFAGEEALTGGDWTVSAETTSTLLQTDVNISSLTVRVFLPPLRLTLSVDQGVPSGELGLVRLSVASESSRSEDGFAVSPDGRWLINAGRNLELWEIDSVRGIVTQRMSSPQSGSSRGLAVSPDSRFVFVTDKASTGAITVWRLNADDGTLAEVAQYTEGGEDAAGNPVRGLTSVWDAVLSPDGRLLFVTSRGESDTAGGALSVWSVNPSGTLVQTNVHLSDGALDTEGLNRAAGAAVTPDGRLLFVGSFYGFSSLEKSTLGIWRVNAEAPTVSFVRFLSDPQMLPSPRFVTLRPDGRFLFVSSQVGPDAETTGPLSVYRVDAAGENLEHVASYREDEDILGDTIGLAATREVLAVAELAPGSVALWQRNDDGTLRFTSRHASVSPVGVAASPAGGLIFSNSFNASAGISVWQVQGIPRVPAGQEVRVMVSAEPTLGSALTVMVQARQGSRVSMAAATLTPSDTQAEAVFSGSDLGYGEWIFSVSVPEDMENIADASRARATLRIAAPPIRLSNLSGVIQQGADLNIRISTEGMAPVAGDTEVTLRATQEGAEPRTVMGVLLEGQTSVTVTFADENALPEGDWLLSAESSALPTDASSTLAVIVGPQPRLLLERTGGSDFVALDGTITLTLRLMPAQSSTVTVTVAVADEGSRILQQQQVALSSSLQLTFRASDLGTGSRLFTARGPAGVLEDSGAEVTVQVQEQVSLVLVLNAPPMVVARDEFTVMVSTNLPVPEDATVTVTVSFEGGEEKAVVLPEAASSGTVTLTAPAALIDSLEVTATAAVDIADPDILQVMVIPAEDAQVRVTAQEVQLTLLVPSSPVPAGENFDVTVGVSPALLTNTTVTVVVTFNGSTMRATLTDRDPTDTVTFRAPASGPLNVTAAADTVEPEGLVDVSPAIPQSVQVREMGTVQLTLGAPASVTVGDSFMVAVGVSEETPILPGTTVMVMASFGGTEGEGEVELTSTVSTMSVSFVAPVRAGDFELELSGSVEVTDTLRVTVLGASTQITVVPVQLMLTLEGLENVQAGDDFSVTVGTDNAVPPGTTVTVTVTVMASDGTTSEEPMTTTLTATMSTALVSFMAISAGEVVVTARGTSQTSSGSLEVAVLDADTLTVTVIPPLPRLTLSVDQGAPSGELGLVRLSVASESSRSEDGFAVSPDGRWLINAGRNLELWEIDSVRGIVTRSMSSPQSGSSRGLAVSPDSRFVFVTDKASTGAITVWRLNADDGTLAEVAQYTEGGEDAAGNPVRGLTSVWDAVLSPDGRLLFVTSRGESDTAGGALSVWSVNPSGTLVQTNVHLSAGALDAEGLNRAAGAAVTPDGRLLFVGSYYGSGLLENTTLGIWRVNAETSSVSFVRILSDRRMLPSPRFVTLGPDGRFLFVSSQAAADAETDPLSVYRVDAAGENLEPVASYGVDDDLLGSTTGLAATREVLAVAEFGVNNVTLWQRNASGTLSFVSRHASARPIAMAASPAGGLIFSNSSSLDESAGISVWQVQGIPRVLAGQEVRVMVSAEPALGSALTVMVQARQGSRVSMAAATLTPSDTQAEAVFSGSDLGYGEWIFSASVPEDMENIADASTARATLRIAAPPIRLSNLSGKIQEGADLNIRISTEGMAPVAGDTEVTLRATREGAQPRTVMGLLQDGQTSVTVTFADENALTEGDWLLSAESSALPTDASSTLAVIVGPQPRLLLERTGGSDFVALDGTITLTLRLMPAQSSTVTVTVAVADEGSRILQQQQVALSSSLQLTFRASDLGTGSRLFTARGPAGVLEDSGAEVTVQVQEQVSLVLVLNASPMVVARDEFTVMVSTNLPVPEDATVTVTVSFEGGEEKAVVLPEAASSGTVTLTAPAALIDSLEVTATAAVDIADPDILQVMVIPAEDAQVRVTAQEVQLTLLVPSSPVPAGENFDVTVGVSPALLTNTTVTVVVTFNGSTMRATLTDRDPTDTVTFRAPASGPLNVTAAADTVEPAGLVDVSPAIPQSVQVREMGTVQLTLDAPPSVTVGDSFTVAVGVLEETQIPEETTVMVRVNFDGTEEVVELTDTVSTMSVSFTAPVMSGEFTLVLSGSAVAQDPLLVVMVTGASTPIEVVPVQLTLSLEGPEDVQVGEAFSVTVGTGDDAVPAGTTVMVTVTVMASDGMTSEGMAVLTAAVSTASVSLMAPIRAGLVSVTATGVPQTSSGSLEVAEPGASSLAVTAFGVDVQLSLEGVPEDVATGSTFTITVGASGVTSIPLPLGTTVLVTVSFGDAFTRNVSLTRDASTSTVEVDVPDAVGVQELRAVGVGAEDGALDLNVLPVAATVQVLREVELLLILTAPETAVQAGSSFDVNVSTDLSVPPAATVTVTVGFDGAEMEVMLTAANVSGVLNFTAPARLEPGGLPVTATAAVDIADPDILQVMVDASATAQVRVTAHEVRLTLSESDPDPADAGREFSVTVGVSPALLANTTVTVVVTFNESTRLATLSDRAPTDTVTFTAPTSGTLDVTAAADPDAVEPAGLVDVSPAIPQSVQVREMGTVQLTLDAPASVTVGDSFTVAVGVLEETRIPEETTVMVRVNFDGTEEVVELTDTVSTMSVSFTAPVMSGEFTLVLSSSAVAQDPLLVVMVTGASTPIEVVPVQLTLSLEGPEDVQVGEAFSVTVGTGDDAVPAGTTVMVTVTVMASDGMTSEGMAVLTAAVSTASVSLMAPIRAGLVSVTATGVPQTSSGSLEVAVSDASPFTVTASRVDVQLSLLGVPAGPVPAEGTFTIMVGVSDETPIPMGITVAVTVSFGDEFTMDVDLTMDASLSTVEVVAPDIRGTLDLEAVGAGPVGDEELELNVLPATAPVRVQGVVGLALRLVAPEAVQAGSSFDVTVSTDIQVPVGATVRVTVGFDREEREAVLTGAASSSVVSFTAPARLEPGGLPVTATAAVEVADEDALQVNVDASAVAQVMVTAHEVRLTLSESDPDPADAGREFSVTVGVTPALLANTTVRAVVTLTSNGSTMQATLSDRVPTDTVTFRAPASGPLDVTAAADTVEPDGLVAVADAATRNVRVREMSVQRPRLRLLDAPTRVTVGSVFTVTVGVSDETPIPPGTTVVVVVDFGGTVQSVDLTDMVSTMSVSVTAPVMSGGFPLMLSGTAVSADDQDGMVTGASTPIEVVPVQLTLSLEGPEDVQVGEAFSVTVGTGDDAVPAGTTVMVTVTVMASDGMTSEGMAMLTAAISTASVPFTAPARAGLVSVTATGVPQTSSGSLEVAVSDASPFTVTASRVDVQLSLEGVPEGIVSAGSSFTITVGASGVTSIPLPLGTTVLVTVSFGDAFTRNVSLTRDASTSTVEVDVPNAVGALQLRAAGVGAEGGALDLNVLPAAATVRVQGVVGLALRLAAPIEVQAGSAVDVTVSTDLPVPVGATVRVTVGFDRAEREAVLTDAASSSVVSFTAPARLEPGGLPVTATAAVDIADPDILQVMVDTSATAQVRVTAHKVQLTLSEPDPNPVDAGESFAVTVGVSPALLADTTVAAVVTFNGSTRQATLSDRAPTRTVTFTAPAFGLLEVTAEAVAVEPAGLVEVADAAAQSVQVRPIESTVQLTLDVPIAPVFQGVMFPVRASADDLPPGSTLMVIVSLTGEASTATRSVSLTADNLSEVVMFEAPVAAAAVTTYTVTTVSEMMGAAVLDVTEAEPAMVFVTQVNANLSGDEVFDEGDVILMTRALLTENFAARSEGFGLAGLSPIPDEQRDELQARFNTLADMADISGNGVLDAVDAVFLLRNLNATADSLRNQVDSGDNPFDYLCGSALPDACTDIESPHANITGAGGIQYEIIGERLETLRNVPQPPVLPPRTSQSRSKWEI